MARRHRVGLILAITIALLHEPAILQSEPPRATTRATRTVEIRSYNLEPGSRAEFQRLASEVAVPMLRRRNIDVVAFGPSAHDETSYFLIRSFASIDDRQRSEDAFYGSEEWRLGPRQAVLDLIVSYATVVLELDMATIDALRPLSPGAPGLAATGYTTVADDERAVAALDTQYQKAVERNDAATMDRILADDFVLVTGRGTVQTKADLLKEARDRINIYERQDDSQRKVRVWGDTAVVTALLWAKGTSDGKPFEYKLWFSDTYVRTPKGWRYVFAQASLPLPKTP